MIKPPTNSNIEPLAREMTERICRREGMVEASIPGWVELHWPCAAAMLEAGVMDEAGDWIAGKDLRGGLEAYQVLRRQEIFEKHIAARDRDKVEGKRSTSQQQTQKHLHRLLV